ncbi:TIM barrel protein [Chitinophagaceae bacterium LB-8]|uniref:TIM barrel protein n=1 Tax=Paraflavisolibacter caeni TaxID=2982496 RepID=A0A9X2XV03_9BACT|nr:TIM barrel protein [Paraflavisolibacter caeni]MCU7549027.1 TIM barrel protein [Paraflavisolibacter caeni]
MLHRRKMMKQLVAGTLAAATFNSSAFASKSEALKTGNLMKNINHSVCRWTYSFLSLDELCTTVKKIGFNAIDLVGPKDWATLKKHDVYSSMCNGAEISLTEGWNDKQYHQKLIQNYTEHIDLVAKAGYKNLICFSGNRRNIDDETGMINCAEGIKQIMALAEKKGVIILMELLNSKVNHKDYMCDHTAWGVELCKRVGSENFKLLYDIYHMQIDEGNVIQTITENHNHLGHYHTGGVPGRHEIDESQELYYPAIMRAIVKTGFKGYVAQEFIPAKEDKIASLQAAIKVCDI